MNYEIQCLTKEQWDNYELCFYYETNSYFDVNITSNVNGFEVSFLKKNFSETVKKDFTSNLFSPYFQNQEVYGIVSGNKILAAIELSKEDWNNRLRITELLVNKELRRQGIGKKLMDIAKQRAKELGCRAIILETQSCNENGIAFYFSQGFSLFGFDKNSYSNSDIENNEVRLELGLLM